MTDEERVKLITQIANNFGISCDDASYIIKSFENFGKEFMMSEADKMFYKTNYNNKLEYIEKGKIIYEEYKSMNEYMKFKHDKKEICIEGHITMQELQAIIEKCKELRWIE